MKIFLSLSFFLIGMLNLLIAQEEWTVYTTSNSELTHDGVIGVAIDDLDNKWIATQSTTFDVFDESNWIHHTYTETTTEFGGNFVIDLTGDKWVGGTEGVHKFDGTTWTNYNSVNSGLPDNLIYSIAVDQHNNNKWIGTAFGGLAKFDGSTWEVFNTTNSDIPSGKVYSVAINDSGNVWIGTHNSGLAKFDGSTWTKYNTSNSPLPSNAIFVLAIDPNGNLWAGTLNGVAKFNGTDWTIYTESNSPLPEDYIRSFAFSQDATAWIGTGGGGLARVEGNTWTIYDTLNSPLPDNRVWDIDIENNQEEIWLSTLGGGLAVLDLNTTGTENVDNKNTRVFIRPNLIIDDIILDLGTLAGQGVFLNIFDQAGKLVFEKKDCKDLERIDLSFLVNGIYYAELIIEHNSYSQKLVIQK